MLDSRETLARVCEIDGDQLDNEDTWGCFLLGVEWGMFYVKLREGCGFRMTVSEKNVPRLLRVAGKKGRRVWVASENPFILEVDPRAE